MDTPKLDITGVLLSEALDLKAAAEKCRIIHRTKDISAAGDEVEECVRRLIQDRVGGRFAVHDSHIVDSRLLSSRQCDVVITDGDASALFRTASGRIYVPYESVYAVGEIKTSYERSKKQIQYFSDTVRSLKNEMIREAVLPNYVSGLGELGKGLTTGISQGYRNPLFTFMLFVTSRGFKLSDVDEFYSQHKFGNLPNLVCFLDRGILINAEVESRTEDEVRFGRFNLYPEFKDDEDSPRNGWMLLPLGSEEYGIAAHWAFLLAMIENHLRTTVLKPTEMLTYFKSLFTIGQAESHFIFKKN